MPPVIGITPTMIEESGASGATRRWAVTDTYINAVTAAGGIPIVLPPAEGDLAPLLDVIDGLVFSGGADIDPVLYGDAAVHPKTYDINPVRDGFELRLIKAAAERDIPTLCICRGIQVLNVAFGGTLYQDVPDQYPTKLHHQQQELGIPGREPSHRIDVEAGSFVASVYGQTEIEANSFHHQTLKDVPANLEIAARSEDGSIEAISMPDKTFIVGVQWHPEMMFRSHPEHLRPFSRLIEASSK